ncbi:MAG: ABC transporter substrate-binding protein [Sphaerochaetaceae bacterium]
MRKVPLSVMRVVVSICLWCLLGFSLSAQGAYEAQRAERLVTVDMAVMQGPTGFSSVGLKRNGGELSADVFVEITAYPSPNEVIARLANGELDAAALPTNVAANLFNKGVKCKVAAVVGEGMLALISTDEGITEFNHLANRKILIPGAGSTPDQMTRIVTQAMGYNPDTDVQLDYSVAAPAQVAQMLIAGKADLAVLPEPFISMVLKQNPKTRVLLDIQQLWSALTGLANYPMSVVVVSEAFVNTHPEAYRLFMDGLKSSVEWVNANPEAAGAMIEEAGILKAALAIPAIPRCNLVFRPAKEGKAAMQDYLRILYWFDYDSIGGAIPDDSFYLED